MIIHLDLDCYFASAERVRHPELIGKPLVIGNRTDMAIFSAERKAVLPFEDHPGAFSGACYYNKFGHAKDWRECFMDETGKIRGMVVTASYEARALGIKTGCLLSEALLRCPDVVIRPSDLPYYYQLSRDLSEWLCSQIPVLEQYGIDEFFGDLQGWVSDASIPGFIGQLQQEVLSRFSLPISIGAAPTKSWAKLATNLAKPLGTKVLYADAVQAVLDPLPIEKFPGVGKQLGQQLRDRGIRTLGEIRPRRRTLFGLGRHGQDLYHLVCGINDATVTPHRDRKSVGISRTFAPVLDRKELRRRVIILTRHLAYTIEQLHLLPTTWHFKIGYQYGHKAKESFTHKRIASHGLIKELMLGKFDELDLWPNQRVIYLGMSGSNFLGPAHRTTTSLLDHESDMKARKLTEAAHRIWSRYSVDALRWGVEG